MKILSIDQSTVRSGYSVFVNTDLVKWDILDLHKEKDATYRFKLMCLQLDSLIQKIMPDIVIFEDVSLRASIKTLIDLSRLQGAIIQSCANRDINYVIYPATQWRRMVGITQNSKIKRNELKEQAIEMVRNGYGITVGDDCAEAICIGLAYLLSINKE